MTKNLLNAILLTLTAAVLLSGCSLFATSGGDSGNGSGGSTGAIKMTDSYSFEDPVGLDFDTRYVLFCDENSVMVSSVPAEYGIKASYSIIYTKDDAPVMDYEYFVCDSAEHAQATVDLYAAQGAALTAVESDPCVLYSTTDGDTFEANLMTFQSYGMISEAKVSAYVEFMKTSTGGTILE